MQNFLVKISLFTCLFTAPTAFAQKLHLPGAHKEEHAELIAKQQNIGEQIKVEGTQQFLDQLFKEEEEPEMDIYTEGWDSQLVNPFKSSDVPQSQVIDVSKFHMPHAGYVTSPYGYRRRFRRQHKGIDLKVHIGDTIKAAFDGKVRLTKFERRGYGYYVILRHANGLETVYGHLSKFLVEPDQYVKAGEPIALGGNTGRSTGPHLHFEPRFMGYPINPSAIFDFANQTVHTDTYTFDKDSYQLARNYDPAANSEYQKKYLAEYAEYMKSHPEAARVAAKAAASGSQYYTIKSGDTLGRIASRQGTTINKLCQLNGITTKTTLRIGRKIRIK